MNFKEELEQRVSKVNELIRKYLPREEGKSLTMIQAMNYSMTAGGKRLRPILMEETYRLFGGTTRAIEPFMAGMEMIHTHSLIHDDLPALDNDEYRRGRKTTHVVFGEAMGILSGDALLNYAYEVLFHSFDLDPGNPAIPLALQILASKVGIYGMLGGQGVDVENDGKPLSQETLAYIYKNKTSALIEASMMTGAILAGAEDGKVRIVEKAAEKIGLAFQIQDDILDVESTQEVLGKPIHSDEKNHKTTYVTLKGLEASREEVKLLSGEALFLMDSLEEKNEFLRQLITELIDRKK
ncbi:MAG TPA: polyprenyl synthetase family protein [Candidatus Blautia avistercoris]|uniref:polyprenyl synthetase family protein n=1 Tax=Blautia sp. An249 TaxID=1965603 RepID=UPI000B3674DE|nr:farnesyl diphosphate synthase [Blautia sp. An249]OUO81284.1 farnesyl-diphosphate synthase [Blautia sp. An249]HIY19561.1 polyprenyl synthetase family protein [Candidatus Blautia avistercoris]